MDWEQANMTNERAVTHYVGDGCPGGHRDEACRACGGVGSTRSWICKRCNGTGIEPKEEPR